MNAVEEFLGAELTAGVRDVLRGFVARQVRLEQQIQEDHLEQTMVSEYSRQ